MRTMSTSDSRPVRLVVELVADRIQRFGPADGDGGVLHEAVPRGPVPVVLSRRRVDDVTGPDARGVSVRGHHVALALGHEEDLPAVMPVPVSASTRSEEDAVDGGVTTVHDRVPPHLTGHGGRPPAGWP